MRITNAMMMNQALYDLAGLRQKYAKAQAAVNGRSLERPSEDPQRVVEAMDLSGAKMRLERSQRSGQDAREWLSVVETKVSAILDRLQAARESVVQSGGPGGLDQIGRESLASTLDSIRDSILSELNGQHRDQYVFAGRSTDTKPFTTGGTVTYVPPVDPNDPRDGELTRDVAPGLPITVNVPGHKLGAVEFMQTLQEMSANLRAGAVEPVVGEQLSELDRGINNLIVVRSDLGIRQKQVEDFQYYAQETLLHIEERLSKISGADLETSILRMTEAQNAYQAALASFAKALPTSLLDYMMR